MATESLPEYMTAAEAAEYLRIPLSTLYQKNHRREGPSASRLGRRLVYRRGDLDAWHEANKIPDALSAR